MTRIGINGFGRIGRTVTRILSHRANLEVVAINDLFASDQLAYLLKYDSVMGVFDQEVAASGQAIEIGGRRIALTAERDPGAIRWAEFGAELVVESTGVFTKKEQLEKHLAGGARKVVLTVPAKDEIDATIVLGVNDALLSPRHRLVSNASCTTNCLAPLAKILDDSFGIEEGFMTTVHAYTNDQRLVDVPHKDLRRSRAAAQNLIPTTTGAARTVGKVLPHLKGKLDGMSLRVPVVDGSIVDFTARLRGRPGVAEVNAAVRAAAAGPLARIVEYSEAPLVSSDIVGNPHSTVFDARSTQASGDGYVKVVAWYDNEWGYSQRVADLLERLAEVG
jgi:glyceraldehyde 3-phosphate dehydrogenase (phosphorylating)